MNTLWAPTDFHFDTVSSKLPNECNYTPLINHHQEPEKKWKNAGLCGVKFIFSACAYLCLSLRMCGNKHMREIAELKLYWRYY